MFEHIINERPGSQDVCIETCADYSLELIRQSFHHLDFLFAKTIQPGDTVLIKPNWIAPHHKYNPGEWVSVITHPNFITIVVEKVVEYLGGRGELFIADAPQTDSSFKRIMQMMPIRDWEQMGKSGGVDVHILDLREDEWTNYGGVIVERRKLNGDPLGSVEYNLRDKSEFVDHKPSAKGYYGADVNTTETTEAHSKGNHFYRISKSAVKADVLINLPKWKTHKKAGITCSLKNLVGINTYKNFLPHHNEGTPSMGGDQFPDSHHVGNSLEVFLLSRFRHFLNHHEKYAQYMVPIKRVGQIIFGETRYKVRSGNWYGNDTLWRTILDLNKLLFYGNPDGSLRIGGLDQRKRYLTLVEGIVAGEGNGPEAPDPKRTSLIIGGINPVSVDCAAARLMGFAYEKIPALRNAFAIESLPLVDFSLDDIRVYSRSLPHFDRKLLEIDEELCFHFKPHFGWAGHIELD